MGSMISFLEGLEKLAYRILMWVVLIPKTVFKIIFEPRFAPEYVKQQLEKNVETPFAVYMSPMLLFLIVILIPALSTYFIPVFGVNLVRPAPDALILDRNVDFKAEARFRADTYSNFTEFQWSIYECDSADDCFSGKYLYAESHSDWVGDRILNQEDFGKFLKVENPLLAEQSKFETLDRNTVSNTFEYELKPGVYSLSVFCTNYTDEIVYDAFRIIVPEDIEERIQIYSIYDNYGSIPGRKIGSTDPFYGFQVEQPKSWGERLKSEESILLGFVFLSFPLIFSLFILSLYGVNKQNVKNDLKEVFYTQCYYFAPVGLTFWAWFYSDRYFVNPTDLPLVKGFAQIFFALPLVTVLVWFILVEIDAIARVRQTKRGNAFFVLFVSFVTLSIIVWLFTVFNDNLDILRNSALVAYPVSCGVIIVVAVVRRLVKSIKKELNVNKLE